MKKLLLSTAFGAVFATGALAQEGEPIRVGILHSLSGTMAISETAPLIADWRAPLSCGNVNTATGTCGGAE